MIRYRHWNVCICLCFYEFRFLLIKTHNVCNFPCASKTPVCHIKNICFHLLLVTLQNEYSFLLLIYFKCQLFFHFCFLMFKYIRLLMHAECALHPVFVSKCAWTSPSYTGCRRERKSIKTLSRVRFLLPFMLLESMGVGCCCIEIRNIFIVK